MYENPDDKQLGTMLHELSSLVRGADDGNILFSPLNLPSYLVKDQIYKGVNPAALFDDSKVVFSGLLSFGHISVMPRIKMIFHNRDASSLRTFVADWNITTLVENTDASSLCENYGDIYSIYERCDLVDDLQLFLKRSLNLEYQSQIGQFRVYRVKNEKSSHPDIYRATYNEHLGITYPEVTDKNPTFWNVAALCANLRFSKHPSTKNISYFYESPSGTCIVRFK